MMIVADAGQLCRFVVVDDVTLSTVPRPRLGGGTISTDDFRSTTT